MPRAVLVLLALVLTAPAWAQDAWLGQARDHLTHGRAQQALELLDPLEAELAGNREVDYQRFRVTTGGSVQWRHALGPRTELSAFGQFARLAYPSQPLGC